MASSSSTSIPQVTAAHEEIEVCDEPEKSTFQDSPSNRYECTENFDSVDLVLKGDIPGLMELERDNLTNLPNKRQAHRFKTELEPEDVRLVNELGQLSADQLMEYLRRIKDMASGLGRAQEDQCLRGKFMGIFKQ